MMSEDSLTLRSPGMPPGPSDAATLVSGLAQQSERGQAGVVHEQEPAQRIGEDASRNSQEEEGGLVASLERFLADVARHSEQAQSKGADGQKPDRLPPEVDFQRQELSQSQLLDELQEFIDGGNRHLAESAERRGIVHGDVGTSHDQPERPHSHISPVVSQPREHITGSLVTSRHDDPEASDVDSGEDWE